MGEVVAETPGVTVGDGDGDGLPGTAPECLEGPVLVRRSTKGLEDALTEGLGFADTFLEPPTIESSTEAENDTLR